MKMKILIAGDDFTPALMFKEEIEKKLVSLGKDLDIRLLILPFSGN